MTLRYYLKIAAKRLWQYAWSKRNAKFLLKDWIELNDLQLISELLNTTRFSRNLEPLLLEIPKARRIMVIAPHPDDEILGPGGTIIKAIQSGAHVKIVYLTSGKHSESKEMEQDAVTISTKIGYDIEFLRHPLGNIPITEDSIRELAELFDAYKPEALFLPVLFDDHDDHRRANHLVMETFKNYSSHNKIEVWGYQIYTMLIPNVVIDITETASKKRWAAKAWKTQAAKRAWHHYILGLNAYNVRFLKTAEERYVEAFFVFPLRNYLSLCSRFFSDPSIAYSTDNYHQN